jgi:hypothetical protein
LSDQKARLASSPQQQCGYFQNLSPSSTAFAEIRDVDAAVELLHRVQAASGGMVEAFELIPADILHVLFESFPNIQRPLATIGPMNVLMEIGSTNPADNEVDGNGSSPIRSIMETGS